MQLLKKKKKSSNEVTFLSWLLVTQFLGALLVRTPLVTKAVSELMAQSLRS